MTLRKLSIGIQSFEDIRTNDYLYVDKTEYIWNLVNMGKTYFLSRPRRFGKSLLSSAIEAYFLGKKELFKGLYIDDKEKEWKTYPVLHFDLSEGDYEIEEGLSDTLNDVIDAAVDKYDLTGEYTVRGANLPLRFKNLILMLRKKTGMQVVVLVEEYDTPLLETLENPELLEKNRRLFRSFFRILKSQDANIKFVLISGITRFAKVSIFSDLNQLRDISMVKEYAAICGITEKELEDNFEPEIEALGRENGFSREECLDQLKKNYDGYQFSIDGTSVYNPFSLLNVMQDRTFQRYWFASGTPGFLISLMKSSRISIDRLAEGIQTNEDKLMDYSGDNKDGVSIFYQAGYLTIKGYDKERKLYYLNFPNEEVKFGFLNALVPMFLGESADNTVSLADLSEDLKKGEIDGFMHRLEALLASLPYPESKVEKYEEFWRDRVILIFLLMGEKVKSEVHTVNGRSDCNIETDKYIYIFEFKIDKSFEEALNQIEKNGYAAPYSADPRKLYKVGVNFSSQKRNIEDWKAI